VLHEMAITARKIQDLSAAKGYLKVRGQPRPVDEQRPPTANPGPSTNKDPLTPPPSSLPLPPSNVLTAPHRAARAVEHRVIHLALATLVPALAPPPPGPSPL